MKACRLQPEYKMRKMNHSQHILITCIHSDMGRTGTAPTRRSHLSLGDRLCGVRILAVPKSYKFVTDI